MALPKSHRRSSSILAIVGARPQFVKLAPVLRALQSRGIRVSVVHTGQHHDFRMSSIFFEQLGIPNCDFHLGVHGGTHGQQTGRMIERIEEILHLTKPKMVLVFGDTNSTVAGAMAAAKLEIPIAHIEAGMRSFNRSMPEEINRVVTDHLATYHFCSTPTAVTNLQQEGIVHDIHLVGDVMADILRIHKKHMTAPVIPSISLQKQSYVLVTIHRPQNTDQPKNLERIITWLTQLTHPVIFPIHPRTRDALQRHGLKKKLSSAKHIHLIEPVGYFEMLWLEQHAKIIVTDSGGVQKEAYILKVPCITLRDETEWNETRADGWNTVTGLQVNLMNAALRRQLPKKHDLSLFGRGNASGKIAQVLQRHL